MLLGTGACSASGSTFRRARSPQFRVTSRRNSARSRRWLPWERSDVLTAHRQFQESSKVLSTSSSAPEVNCGQPVQYAVVHAAVPAGPSLAIPVALAGTPRVSEHTIAFAPVPPRRAPWLSRRRRLHYLTHAHRRRQS